MDPLPNVVVAMVEDYFASMGSDELPSSTKNALVQLEPARGVGPRVQVAARRRHVGVAERGLHLGSLTGGYSDGAA
jgi:hypothetical protein